MLDINKIREDFPILSRRIYGKPLVYLDNAATSQTPKCVVDKIAESYYISNANVHRGVHFLSQEATNIMEQSRAHIQRYINARHSHEIIFTRGTTESINLVASSFGEAFMQQGDEIIISEMEHHANIVPWQLLETRKGIRIKVVPITSTGELNLNVFRNLFSEKTKLVSLTYVSNVLGTINPAKEIINIAHQHNVPVLIDGAQAIPHLKVDVQDLDADFFVFSAHKVYGPTGFGVLYGKEKWLDKMPPYQGGGEMIAHVSFEKTTFNELPFKFEAGTPDYVGASAFSTALDYVEKIGIEYIAAHENKLMQYTTQKMLEIPGMRIFGTAPHKDAVISFLIGNSHPYDVGMLLDKMGVAVRTGHHCAQPLMHALGIEATARASFAVYNTQEEADIFIDSLKRAAV
ncbi:MAG: cysteine desulfurase, partial [Bacteroidaceae bacterium]|nr:cysteine desulfurase [Bacteroidaceae bacterium]